MKLFSLILLLAIPAHASLVADALGWASELVSGGKSPTLSRVVEVDQVKTMASWSYTDCGLASDVIQLKSIKVRPDPPVPGKNLTVNVEADVLETIEEGAWADVTVKLGLIKLFQKRFDLCEEALNNNASVQCPVHPGPYKVEQTVALPKEIPKAKFSVQIQGYTVNDDDMVCLDLFADFVSPLRAFWCALIDVLLANEEAQPSQLGRTRW
nr:phosphatidylglycerol/phosphatidylinositol transfer protein [Cryptococcus depauperatus CBS 7841]